MELARGTRLGTYEILGPLGAGGMGEVYRARDLQLGREVAVKVLPRELASSPDRIARLDRAYARRDGGPTERKPSAHLRSLHGDPRWSGFMRRMRLEG